MLIIFIVNNTRDISQSYPTSTGDAFWKCLCNVSGGLSEWTKKRIIFIKPRITLRTKKKWGIRSKDIFLGENIFKSYMWKSYNNIKNLIKYTVSFDSMSKIVLI